MLGGNLLCHETTRHECVSTDAKAKIRNETRNQAMRFSRVWTKRFGTSQPHR